MDIESSAFRATASTRPEREDDREQTIAHGHCEHWEHSGDSGGTIDDAGAWAAVLRRDRSFDGRFVT
ncbi:MAG TPA: hypothetical protein VI168_08665, partial [Croceibacterium sp.]